MAVKAICGASPRKSNVFNVRDRYNVNAPDEYYIPIVVNTVDDLLPPLRPASFFQRPVVRPHRWLVKLIQVCDGGLVVRIPYQSTLNWYAGPTCKLDCLYLDTRRQRAYPQYLNGLGEQEAVETHLKRCSEYDTFNGYNAKSQSFYEWKPFTLNVEAECPICMDSQSSVYFNCRGGVHFQCCETCNRAIGSMCPICREQLNPVNGMASKLRRSEIVTDLSDLLQRVYDSGKETHYRLYSLIK